MTMKPKKISENVTLFSANPVVYVVSDFLSSDECAAFVEVGAVSYTHSTLPTNR